MAGATPHPLNLGCRLGQGILFSKPFQTEQLDPCAQGRRKNLLKAAGRIRSRPPEESAQDRRKDLLKAAGTLAGKTAAAGAVADVESCRPGEPSQQIAEIRTA
jgi:hypothetical protein